MIGEKLIRVMEACRFMTQDKVNTFHGYKYTSAAGAFAKINEEFVKVGLFTQSRIELVESRDVTSAKGNVERYAIVKVTIQVMEVETGEHVEFEGLGSGQDAGDKAVMKASTAATKYAYLSGLCLAMTDDPETDSNTTAYESPTYAPPSPPIQSTPAQSTAGNPIVGKCEICGDPVTAKNMLFANRQFQGRKLCYNCQQNLKSSSTPDKSTPF